MVVYNWFARARNWPPRVVDELDLDEVEWLPLLEEACQQASEVIQKEIEAQS
jgi:hypothetical protein